MATESLPANPPLSERLSTEADLCRNDGAADIAALLDEAAAALIASEKRAYKYEAAFKDSNASFQVAFAGCGARNTRIKELEHLLVNASMRLKLPNAFAHDLVPFARRIDEALKEKISE